MRLKDLHPRRFFLDTWRDLDASARERKADASEKSAGDALIVCYIFCVVTISLILQEYLGDTDPYIKIIDFIDDPGSPGNHPFLWTLMGWIRPDDMPLVTWLTARGYYELGSLCYWASWRIFGFLVIPAVAIACHPRLRKMPMGLSFKGMSKHLWVYGVLFVPVLVAVVIVSFDSEFQEYYPFYRYAHRSLFDFLVWEAFYMAQFLSLEFFFRGFMIQPLKRIMGSSAIFAMMIPYVMIHIGKPMVECFAAIIAGIVLGTLALRTRSIWSGFLIHMSVALSMDLLAIWQKL